MTMNITTKYYCGLSACRVSNSASHSYENKRLQFSYLILACQSQLILSSDCILLIQWWNDNTYYTIWIWMDGYLLVFLPQNHYSITFIS